MGKLIKRIFGSCLLDQVYQTLLQECMLNHSVQPHIKTCILEALPGKLDTKRHSPCRLYRHLLSCFSMPIYHKRGPDQSMHDLVGYYLEVKAQNAASHLLKIITCIN